VFKEAEASQNIDSGIGSTIQQNAFGNGCKFELDWTMAERV
jgi:hypothetical protein